MTQNFRTTRKAKFRTFHRYEKKILIFSKYNFESFLFSFTPIFCIIVVSICEENETLITVCLVFRTH